MACDFTPKVDLPLLSNAWLSLTPGEGAVVAATDRYKAGWYRLSCAGEGDPMEVAVEAKLLRKALNLFPRAKKTEVALSRRGHLLVVSTGDDVEVALWGGGYAFPLRDGALLPLPKSSEIAHEEVAFGAEHLRAFAAIRGPGSPSSLVFGAPNQKAPTRIEIGDFFWGLLVPVGRHPKQERPLTDAPNWVTSIPWRESDS
jgi:hypothetical protein